ncbi:MAG: hypothetical protein Q8P81_00325 [Nanoarchaeota archaeon]|nr:hypothetical protein [Nanoarchaeota archaeon]
MEEIYDLAFYGASVIGGHITLLTTAQIIENIFSQRITSEDELEKIVAEESEKMNLRDRRLVLPLYIGRDDPDYKNIRGSRCTVRGFDRKSDEFVPQN